MRRLLLISVIVAVPACSGGSSGNGSSEAPAASTPGVCAMDGTADTYAPGMTKAGDKGLVRMTLASATPAPPNKGQNDWTIALADASGAPIDGADVSVKLYMPQHMHGGSVVPTIAPKGGGSYVVENIELPMAGLWELTFTVGTPSGSDTVKFAFCAAG